MNESEVNEKVKDWALQTGYTYKGVLANGEIPVPTTLGNDVKIDALLEKLPNERIWVESKGKVGLSTLLQGLIRLAFALYYGGGKALLAIDHEMIERLQKYEGFLKWMCEGLSIGLFNADTQKIIWL